MLRARQRPDGRQHLGLAGQVPVRLGAADHRHPHPLQGQEGQLWLGPGEGYGTVLGQNWLPYQEPTVLTPPFPKCVSGHSTFSAAGRTVMLQFYGNNGTFNGKVVIKKGTSKIEPTSPRPRTSPSPGR